MLLDTLLESVFVIWNAELTLEEFLVVSMDLLLCGTVSQRPHDATHLFSIRRVTSLGNVEKALLEH